MVMRTDEGSKARKWRHSRAGKVLEDSEGIGKGVESGGHFAGRSLAFDSSKRSSVKHGRTRDTTAHAGACEVRGGAETRVFFNILMQVFLMRRHDLTI
jgi:hypothetical protein